MIGVDGSTLVHGFEHRPALTVPYNYSYYDDLIQHAGFRKLTDLLSGYLPADHVLPPRLVDIAAKVKARRGFWVKQFSSRAEIRRWIPQVMAVHRAAFSQTASFYPPTEREVAHIIGSALAIVDPKLVKLVMKGDEIAGFILAYADVSAGLVRPTAVSSPPAGCTFCTTAAAPAGSTSTGWGCCPATRAWAATPFCTLSWTRR
jgi:hypothetical protein